MTPYLQLTLRREVVQFRGEILRDCALITVKDYLLRSACWEEHRLIYQSKQINIVIYFSEYGKIYEVKNFQAQ